VYCLRMFYNQVNCCKGLKDCMNGLFFSFFSFYYQMTSAKTVGQKVGGSRIGEPRGPKSGGKGLGSSGPVGVYAYAEV